jgi:mono/diheme cytochrome c family protein
MLLNLSLLLAIALLQAPARQEPERQGAAEEGAARGAAIHKDVCANCHGEDGKGRTVEGAGLTLAIAPPFAGSSRITGHRDYVIHVLLHGLTGTIDGKIYPGAMLPVADKSDEWIASIASYIRNSFGNSSGVVTRADVARVREATKDRKDPWTVEELHTRLLPHVMDVTPGWRVSASTNASGAARALSAAGWTSGTPQRPGMWFQLELPAATTLTQLQFGSVPTGGRGIGAAPVEGATSGSGANGEGATSPARPATRAPNGEGARGRGAARPPGGVNASGASEPSAEFPATTRAGGPRGIGAREPTVPSGITPAGAPAGTPPPIGYPRGYRVQISLDGNRWSEPIAQGAGRGPLTDIAFPPVEARFVRITQTDAVAGAPPWSIVNLKLWEMGK